MHATQTQAARNIASIFGGNLNGLGDEPTGASALTVANEAGTMAAGGQPGPQPQSPPQSSGLLGKGLIAVGAFAVFSAAIHGSIVGGVAGSSWRSVQRGALIDASLASVGTGIGGLVVGETKIGAGFLILGILGTAGSIYLSVKKRSF